MTIKKLTFYGLMVFFLSLGEEAFSQPSPAAGNLFHHVLLFKWKEDASLAQKSEMIKLFKGLPDKVVGFESFEMSDVSLSTEGFDSILILKFTSETAMKEYEAHADHQRIAKTLGPAVVGKFAVVDYWE